MRGRDHDAPRTLPLTITWWSAAFCVVISACSFDALPLDAPGEPRASAVEDRPALPGAHVFVEFERSGDHDGGNDLVAEYVILRATDDGPFLPIRARKAVELEKEGLAETDERYVDESAVPGRSYRYRVIALADTERSTYAGPGAIAATSEPSAPLALPGETPDPIAQIGGEVTLRHPDAASGMVIELELELEGEPTGVHEFMVWRADGDDEFAVVPSGVIGVPTEGTTVEANLAVPDDSESYRFQIWAVPLEGDAWQVATTDAFTPSQDWFNPQKLNVLFVLVLIVALSFGFLWAAQRGRKIFIRRIPGVDAIEEAVGRATEMGRPIMYIPGIDEIQHIQTIASLLILGRVSEMIARYDSEILVPCRIPLVSVVAEEVVRQGFYDAGRPDAHRPKNIQWISSEQFAFCAGANGIMLREKPATNIYLGRFFAESLILAETGYVNRAIQVAGTAAIPQLPFFIAACDYTLIGEELFAVSAYMSREPRLLSSLKAADWIKALCIIVLVVGTILSVFAHDADITQGLIQFLSPGG